MDQYLNEVKIFIRWGKLSKIIHFEQNITLVTTFYQNNLFQCRIAIILFIIILFYILGRKNRDKNIQKILQKLNNSDLFQAQLANNKLKTQMRSKLMTRILIYTFVALLVQIAIAFFNFTEVIWLVIQINCLIIFLEYIYKLYLSKKQKKQAKYLGDIAKQTDKQIDQLIKLFGSNLTNRLKQKLQQIQRQIIFNKNKQACVSPKCKEQKVLLKQGIQFCQKTINEFTTHKWCSFCSSQIQQKKIHEIPLKIDLKNLKIKSLKIEQMKTIFNELLQYYNKKIIDLQSVCKQGCTKQFCTFLRPISEKFNEQYVKTEKKLSLLK